MKNPKPTTTAKVIVNGLKLQLTTVNGRKIAKSMRGRANRRQRQAKPSSKPKSSLLMRRLYSVHGKPIHIKRRLGRAEINQAIVHFNQEVAGLEDRRQCGVPVTVVLPDMGVEIETRLVPQWRFGSGMRGTIIRSAMKGKSMYNIVEKDGKLVLTFK